MILEDEAGYYAVMLPLKRIPEYRFRVIRGSRKETFYDAYEYPCQITEEEERAFVPVSITRHMRSWERILGPVAR